MKISFKKFIILKTTLKPDTDVQIVTGSMHPFIKVGEYIKVSPREISKLEVGDIILFWQQEKLVCHMLMRISLVNGVYTLHTKGLTSNKLDEPITQINYFGLVTYPTIGPVRRLIVKLYIFLKGYS